MQKSVNLLPFDVVKGKGTSKITRNKEVYQLKLIDDENYTLSPFTMLTFSGYLNAYLAENCITLCYIVEEKDTLLKEAFSSYIKTYDVLENGNLKIHDITKDSQKSKKEI